MYWLGNEQIKATGYDESRVFVQDLSTLQTSYIEIDNGRCIDYCSKNNRVVLGLESGEIQVWDVESGEMIRNPMYDHENEVICVSFSMDGKRVVSEGSDESVRVWDVESGEMIGNAMYGHEGWVRSVSFSMDGKRVVSGGDEDSVRVWDVESGEMIGNAIYGEGGRVRSVSFSTDGKRVVSESARREGDWNVVVWDVESNRQSY